MKGDETVKSSKNERFSRILDVFHADFEQKNALFERFFFRCSPDM